MTDPNMNPTPQIPPQEPLAPTYQQPQTTPEYAAQTAPATPQYTAPQNAAPQYTAPQYTAPQYTAPTPGMPPQSAPVQPAIIAAPPLNKPYYGVPLIEAIKRFFTKYAVFKGRASRSEFWWVILFFFVVNFVISFIGNLISASTGSWLQSIWFLAILVPMIALAIRRLHDTNTSGWWVLLVFIPLVLAVILSRFIFVQSLVAVARINAGQNPNTAASGVVALFIPFVLLSLLSGISGIVLMVRASKPEGARFDDDFQPITQQPIMQQPIVQQPIVQQPTPGSYDPNQPPTAGYPQP